MEYSEDEVARIFTNLIADSMQSPDYVAVSLCLRLRLLFLLLLQVCAICAQGMQSTFCLLHGLFFFFPLFGFIYLRLKTHPVADVYF